MHEKECTNEVLGLADSLAPCTPLTHGYTSDCFLAKMMLFSIFALPAHGETRMGIHLHDNAAAEKNHRKNS